jgi:hypothetical protein
VIEGVVVLSVVLEVVKNKNPAVYNRIKALCLNKARRFYVFANELHRCTCILIYTMVCSLLVFFLVHVASILCEPKCSMLKFVVKIKLQIS